MLCLHRLVYVRFVFIARFLFDPNFLLRRVLLYSFGMF